MCFDKENFLGASSYERVERRQQISVIAFGP